jgi:hypothetical protein
LSCGFEEADGQLALLHRGLLFRRKAGPSAVQGLSQESGSFGI